MTEKNSREAGVIAPVNSLPAGTRLQEYEIHSVIGEGGFGIVYLAYDNMLGREVAIKEYLPITHAVRLEDGRVEARLPAKREVFEKGLQSFVSEAKILAKFKHPALVEVLRFWEANGTAYMVMPYYRGKTLRAMIRAGYRAETTETLFSLLLPLLEGLQQIHGVGCYHRDISPDNIMVLENGAPVLLDFGAARHVLVNENDPTTIILKPGFAPIEQYSEEETPEHAQGPWTDIYALSAVAYQLVTGTMPVISVARIIRDPLKPLTGFASPTLPAALLAVIDEGLAVKPRERPQSITIFTAALRKAARQTASTETQPVADDAVMPSTSEAPADEGASTRDAVSETPAGPEEAAVAPPPQVPVFKLPERKALWGGIAALLLVGIVVLFFALSGSDDPGGDDIASSSTARETPVANEAVATTGNERTLPLLAGESWGEQAPPQNGDLAFAPENANPFSAETLTSPGDGVSPVDTVATTEGMIQPGTVDESGSVSAAAAATEEEMPGEASQSSADGEETLASAEGDVMTSAADSAETAGPDSETEGAPPPMGRIEVTIKPWGNVYLNGDFVGTVPPRLRLDVPEGRNTIEIRNESNDPYVREIELKGGEFVRINHDFYLRTSRNEEAAPGGRPERPAKAVEKSAIAAERPQRVEQTSKSQPPVLYRHGIF